MSAQEVSPAELLSRVERAIETLARCLTVSPLPSESRRHLLLTVDLLAFVWSRVRRDGALPESEEGSVRALLALCEATGVCEAEELPLVLRAAYRLVEGWGQVAEVTSAPVAEVAAEANVPSAQEATHEEVFETPVTEPEALAEEPEVVEPAPVETALPEPPAAPPKTVPPELEPPPVEKESVVTPPPVEGRLQELQAQLAAQMEQLERQIDHIQSHQPPDEEAVPLLIASACRYRRLQPLAAECGREWELRQLKHQLVNLTEERFPDLWVPPLDPSTQFSEHELQTLQTGYEALAKSWQIWRWYRQHSQELDKGTGKPLLESIVAPVPLIWQVWTSKQLLNGVQEQDGTATLREKVLQEAGNRKWKMDMLLTNSPRTKQMQYIHQADEHWEAARRMVEKKEQQRAALERLQAVLANPNQDTFEDDLLRALVACHRVQIPYSNKELRELMRGYDFLLENPAVPEQCGLTGSEASAARRFLVNLGKHLRQSSGEETPQEQPPEEETTSEQHNDLLRRARQFTQGKKLFLLCFNRRAEAEQHIREALQFAEVDWPDLDGGESLKSLESHIRNADMTVVVVRYSRTHWKEARDIARQYGKQFVMATKGYGVTHLAQQIVEQCGKAP